MTNQDIELVHLVFQLRLATLDQLSSLAGRSVRALWGRLPKLAQHRYLTSVARHLQKNVYAVGPEGILALVEYGYAPKEIGRRRLRDNERSEIGIRHSLFVVDIHTRLLLLTRTGEATLDDWQEGPALWDSVTPSDSDSAIPIRPDAYFILSGMHLPATKDRIHIFLEADRSTMAHSRMETKIAGYVAYHSQRAYLRKYPTMSSFKVAVITETPGRARVLRASLDPLIPKPARRAYHFLSIKDIDPGFPLNNKAEAYGSEFLHVVRNRER